MSDYDITHPEDLQRARAVLDELKASSSADDTTEFDPTGTSGHTLSPDKSFESARSVSDETDFTSLSNGVSSLSIGSGSDEHGESLDNGDFQDYENLDIATKAARLQELFPTESARDISYTLKKCEGSFTRAMDVLLNYVFLRTDDAGEMESATPWRSIDAFAEEYVIAKGKKRKPKGRKFRSLEGYDNDELNAAPPSPNRWTSAEEDITFIASLTSIPRQKISSVYHQNNASRNSTILALIQQNISQHGDKSTGDLALEPGVLQFTEEHPTVSTPHAAAILRLTHPSTAKAQDLAKALKSSPAGSGITTPSRIVPHYAPYKDPSAASTLRSSSPSVRSTHAVDGSASATRTTAFAPAPSPRSSSPSAWPTQPANGSTASLSAARATAFDQASKYYRKSKSDHLMGGAAAYYSQLGRDYHASLVAQSAAEADALVARQSTSTMLDLHGVGVKDGVRIAEERVGGWWEGLGESRARMGSGRAVGEGYKIVTGVGRHSDGGVPKLGPAVARALVREGWKVKVAGGMLFVTGKVKR